MVMVGVGKFWWLVGYVGEFLFYELACIGYGVVYDEFGDEP